jgi:hypothetical protein
MSKTIDVSGLPTPLVEALESLVNTYREKANDVGRPVEPRPIGWLKGQWELPDSFFDPLPNELLDLFEGTNGGAR